MLDARLYETIRMLGTTFFGDAMVKLGMPQRHLDHGIRPVVPFTRMAGTAVTVRLEVARDAESADLTIMRQAYANPPESPASIMVIQVPKELHSYGIVGDGGATRLRAHGYVGALVDGGVRDTEALKEMGFPVFARVITPGYIIGKAAAAASGEPVVIGGRTIHQGDLVVADNDGVVVVRPDELEAVVAKAVAIQDWEQRAHEIAAQGQGYDQIMKQAGPAP